MVPIPARLHEDLVIFDHALARMGVVRAGAEGEHETSAQRTVADRRRFDGVQRISVHGQNGQKIGKNFAYLAVEVLDGFFVIAVNKVDQFAGMIQCWNVAGLTMGGAASSLPTRK